VQLHDFGVSSDGRPYYAMELLEGETLDRYLERERGMDWREATRIGIETCTALGAKRTLEERRVSQHESPKGMGSCSAGASPSQKRIESARTMDSLVIRSAPITMPSIVGSALLILA
jgi:hypothetical protein